LRRFHNHLGELAFDLRLEVSLDLVNLGTCTSLNLRFPDNADAIRVRSSGLKSAPKK